MRAPTRIGLASLSPSACIASHSESGRFSELVRQTERCADRSKAHALQLSDPSTMSAAIPIKAGM